MLILSIKTADVAHVVNLGICQHALRHYSMAIESFQHGKHEFPIVTDKVPYPLFSART
jgi:hypothetical protein